MEKNKTVLQKIASLFNKNNDLSYSVDPKTFAGLSGGDVEEKVKEIQQFSYLQHNNLKLTTNLRIGNGLYESMRLVSYRDYEEMEYTPEISQALNVYSQEATSINEQGNVLTVNSNSERVKTVLENLFYNTLNVNSTLNGWARSLCKYGEVFVHLGIVPTKGIVKVRPLPGVEIVRKEPDFTQTFDGTTTNDVRFIWSTGQLEFTNLEVAHFRLLLDDKKLPYGTSVLENSRRIWRQVLMAEDAMLGYRVIRAPERRVVKVDVGNMDDKDIPAYVQSFANDFKRRTDITIDGQTNNRYNTLAIDEDFFVPVRGVNGIQNPIETLPGASNLGDIADIEYLQNKLLASLGVVKSFVGFQEEVGEGKNLSIMDVRFARTVHKIQQALIMELNKIAVMHLYLLGFEDEIDNFRISLNNPSIQSKLLEIDLLKAKIDLYTALVTRPEKGFAAYSHHKALKEVFGMSDDEIRLDLAKQVIESAAAIESNKISEVIAETGIFAEVYQAYGIDPEKLNSPDVISKDENGNPIASDGSAAMLNSAGAGPSFGSDLATDFSSSAGDSGMQMPGVDEIPDLAGTIAGDETPESGEPNLNNTDEEPNNKLNEADKLLSELADIINKTNKKLPKNINQIIGKKRSIIRD